MALQIETKEYKDVYCKLDKINWASHKEIQTHQGDDLRESISVTFAVYPSREDRLADPASSSARSPITVIIPLSDILNSDFLKKCYDTIKSNNNFISCIDA